MGFLRGTSWGSRSLFHQLSPHWTLQSEVMGTYLPVTGTLGLGMGTWCWAGTPYSRDLPPKFLSTTHGCGTSPFCVSALLTSLDGCGFFNSVVVRLPFNSISDSSQQWLFYNLVVIFMWLWEEISYVYLCHHVDWKSSLTFSEDGETTENIQETFQFVDNSVVIILQNLLALQYQKFQEHMALY